MLPRFLPPRFILLSPRVRGIYSPGGGGCTDPPPPPPGFGSLWCLLRGWLIPCPCCVGLCRTGKRAAAKGPREGSAQAPAAEGPRGHGLSCADNRGPGAGRAFRRPRSVAAPISRGFPPCSQGGWRWFRSVRAVVMTQVVQQYLSIQNSQLRARSKSSEAGSKNQGSKLSEDSSFLTCAPPPERRTTVFVFLEPWFYSAVFSPSGFVCSPFPSNSTPPPLPGRDLMFLSLQ